MQTRARGRSRGRRADRSVSQNYDPPRDLAELRRTCPNVKWGNNAPVRNMQPQMVEEHAAGRGAGGLPAAYLQATRGVSPAPPVLQNGASFSRQSTSSRPSRAVSSRKVAANALMATAFRTPWKCGTSTPRSGYFGTPSVQPSVPGDTRSNASKTHARPRSPSASMRVHNVHGSVSATHPAPFKPAVSGNKSPVPGLGDFSCNAGERRPDRTPRTPRSERSYYSKGPRRRTPSPRPRGASVARSTASVEPRMARANYTAPQLTNRLFAAMQERTETESQMRHYYADPALEIAPHMCDQPPVLQNESLVMGSVGRASMRTTGSRPPSMPPKSPTSRSEMSGFMAAAIEEEEAAVIDAHEASPLHIAAHEGDLAAVNDLLDQGADVAATLPGSGKTPLDLACDSLETAAIHGDDVEVLREVVSVLDGAYRVVRERIQGEDPLVETNEMMGADIYRPLLKTMPRTGWDMIVDMMPEQSVKRVSRVCKGLQALMRPRIMLLRDEQPGKKSQTMAALDDDLAIACFNVQRFGPQKLQDLARSDEPTTGTLRILQMICVIVGNQWLSLHDTWPVAKYLIQTESPIQQLLEKAKDPEKLTWDQVNWLLSIFDEHANEMAVACDAFLGSILTLIISTLSRLGQAGNRQLPPLRLPEGYIPPSQRSMQAMHAVTTLNTDEAAA
eukprot:TRINITY_DN22558_c0_g1_i1.p1 TRINITY_DN22558_c0_g1~~TRINITY_DN22558_c0_g1_i1.p1  ORF type:complete len:674 (+),score=162.03 TRINITY_DN22558_c0_g1_i1:46-2067(+)